MKKAGWQRSGRPTYFNALLAIAVLVSSAFGFANKPFIERIATGLNNPRGVLVLAEDHLYLVEAGTGFATDDPERMTGRILELVDRNRDGDFDDQGERSTILDDQYSYNSLYVFGTGRDEVGGLGDIAWWDDGRIVFTKDDPRTGYVADGNSSDIGVGILELATGSAETWVRRFATVNSVAYDREARTIYMAASGANRLLARSVDGSVRIVTIFDALAHGQQAVPAGLALDPITGEVLVALFSGTVYDYYGTRLAFYPGDAQVVRVDPQTGTQTVVIDGLTAAVDVAADEDGTLFVLELTTAWPTTRVPDGFDLFDRTEPPDPGGYARFAGRVTVYPKRGGEPLILASGLDAPSNLTYAEGALYISTGQGTPGRAVLGPGGVGQIKGELYRIEITP